MGGEYRTKVLKLGNSLPLRLPKALDLAEGAEMRVREEQGRYIAELIDTPKRKIDLAGIWGSVPGLRPLKRPQLESRELDREGKQLRRD